MAKSIKTPETVKAKQEAFARIQAGDDNGIRAFLKEKKPLIERLESEREDSYEAAAQSVKDFIIR